MLIYPEIDPVAIRIGPLSIHWYGLMYVMGFLAAWGLALLRSRQKNSSWTAEQVSDLIFYCAIGVVVGGRVGYMLFYNFADLTANPLNLFKVWQGGMSFHGGLLGVAVATWVFARKTHKGYFEVTDFTVPLVPIGLGAGRLGNFINGGLWGRETTMPWGMVFPHAGLYPRHPSQLYEFALEGVLLFLILWIYSSRPRPRMAVSALFLICYSVFRFSVEFFRQPDWQLGFVAFDWMSMGQLLSLPMFVVGVICLWYAWSRDDAITEQ